MLHMVTFALATMIGGFSHGQPYEPYGELTVTEDLIRREIIRLGGDWEAGRKPLLVSFLSDKFQSRHFEMLTHLPTVQYFSAYDCPIDHFALACLSQVRQLEQIHLHSCKLESKSFSLLRGNRELRKVYFESIPVSDELIAEIAKLKQLKMIVFIDCEGMTAARLSMLATALPDTEIAADVITTDEVNCSGAR